MKILALVDVYGWCWSKTAESLAANMPLHDVQVCTYEELPTRNCDLLYIRGMSGQANSTEKVRRACPNAPIVATFTTGGFRMANAWDRTGTVLSMADVVVAQNEEARQWLLAKGIRRVEIIPPGVDTDAYHPDPAAKTGIVGMAANIKDFRWKSKGVEPTIEACERLGLKFECATARTAQAKGGEWCIGYLSPEDMPQWYRSLWCYCMPSSVEGCSNSINEAMATGLPCIICRAGYHGEACQDGRESKTGQVLFVEQTADSVAAALQWLEDNPTDARRIGRNARRWAVKHSAAASAAKHQALFEEVYRLSAPTIVTTCTASYADCLRVTLPTWLVNSGAGRIIVATDNREEMQAALGIDDFRVEFHELLPPGLDWIGAIGARTKAVQAIVAKLPDGTKVAHLDADCIILDRLAPAWSAQFDIAATRWTGRREDNEHNGTAQLGVWFGRAGEGLRSFVDMWFAIQCQFGTRQDMANAGKVSFDQYAFTAALGLWYAGWLVESLPESVWNLNGKYADLAERITTTRPAIVHMKGGTWRDEELVAMVVAVHATAGQPVSMPSTTKQAKLDRINARRKLTGRERGRDRTRRNLIRGQRP